jgi:hypothetical protein
VLTKRGKGGGDAWLLVPGDRWYAVEAKYCETPEEMAACLAASRTQLDSIDERDHAGAGLALCYCVPYERPPRRKGYVEELARTAMSGMPDAALVVGYTAAHVPVEGGYASPGMIALGVLKEWTTASPSRRPR